MNDSLHLARKYARNFPADIIRFGMRNVFRIFIVLDIRFKCLKDYNP